ncbi:MAG: S-layer homology domain-containing protein [Bacillota bacterium]
MKSKGLFCLMAAAVFLLACGTVAAQADEGFTEFKDTQGYWAAEAIARVNALGLVRGYPDGTFLPRNEVSRQELVVMVVRTLGLEDEAQRLDVNALRLTLPADVSSWAKGPVALAVQKGWISQTGLADVPFRAAATRLDVAVLVASALKLSPENALLTFADLQSIPANYRPYVAAVVRAGIMTGVPGNRFEPWRGVTRAEMTALMAKMLDAGLVNPVPGRYFTAELVTADSRRVVLRTAAGSRTYDLAAFNLVYKGADKVAVSTLRAGDNVRVVLDADNRCRFLAYTESGVAGTPSGTPSETTTTYRGTVDAVRLGTPPTLVLQPESGGTVSLPLRSDVRITRQGTAQDLTALYRGAAVEVRVTAGQVTEIIIGADDRVPQTGNIRAYVINKYLDYFSVRYDNGTRGEVNVSPAFQFFRGTSSADYGALSRGARVELIRPGTAITGVRVLDEAKKVFGEVVTVRAADITVEDGDKHQVSLSFAAGVTVRDADGNRMAVEDVKAGDRVALQLDAAGKVAAVALDLRQGEKEGIVTYLRTATAPRITIEDSRGRSETYMLVDDVQVTRDGLTRQLRDVVEGDRVRLVLNRHDEVIQIVILEKDVGRQYRGKVTALNLSRYEITIERDGRSTKYELDRNVKAERDGRSLYIDEVLIGAEVELVLAGSRVTTVKVTEDKNIRVEGEIVRVDLDRERLTIEQASGGVFRFFFESNAVLRDRGGSALRLRDLREGWEVRLELRNGEIRRLDVL